MSRFSSMNVSLNGMRAFQSVLREFEALPEKVQVRAVQTLKRKSKTEARRDIQAEYNLKARRINDGLYVRDTTDGVAVVGRSRGINAIAFGAKWSSSHRGKSKRGAYFAIKRGQTKEPQDGAFIARGRSGNELVFERKGQSRLPLHSVYGPSVAQMLKHGRRPDRIADFAARILADETRRLLEREQQKAARRAARSAKT